MSDTFAGVPSPVEPERPKIPRRRLLKGGAAVVGAAALLGVRVDPASSASQAGQRLDGSWIRWRTLPDGSVGPRALWTFLPEGGALQTNINHPIQSPGHGAWERTGDREFAVIFWIMTFDENRNNTGFEKVRAQFKLNERLDEFTGVVQANFFDVAQNLVRSAESIPVTFQRIVVERLA